MLILGKVSLNIHICRCSNTRCFTYIINCLHRYHLKAIESLTEDIPDNSSALISNLDLILKWLTLRFFDTNPSVLLKGLEYLQVVFSMLVENGHILLENEASSFIPYLILKVYA